MRYGLLLAIAGLFLSVVNAAAADTISGTVLSMDPETGMIVIRQEGTQRRMTLYVSPKGLARSVRIGDAVRARGEFSKRDGLRFHASQIKTERAPGMGGGDPTGVRSRLHKGKGSY